MVQYIFVIGPVDDATTLQTRVLEPLLLIVTRWTDTRIVVLYCEGEVANNLRVVLESEQWPFLFSSSPNTSRGRYNDLLSETLGEQWAE